MLFFQRIFTIIALLICLTQLADAQQTLCPQYKCDICGKTIKDQYYEAEGKNICVPCHRAMTACTQCGKEITGKYYWDNRKNKYCSSCYEQTPICINCRRPVDADTDKQYPMCSRCSAGTVNQKHILDGIFHQVTSQSLRIIGLHAGLMADNVDFAAPQDLEGLFERTSSPHSFHRYDGQQMAILIRKNMSLADTCWALAYEYGYALHSRHGQKNCNPLFIDGFCQWLAFKVTESSGYPQKAQTMKNSGGEMLQKWLEIENRRGIEGTVQIMKYNQSF